MAIQMNFETSTSTLASRSAEQIVLVGARCWIAGYEHGDIHCWETAWRHYSRVLGAREGRLLLSELQYWVRVLRDVSVRTISFYPHCCRHICADECVGLCLLAAYQHQDLATARGAAHQLSGLNPGSAFDLLTDASANFAEALSGAGQRLLPIPLNLIEQFAILEGAAGQPSKLKH